MPARPKKRPPAPPKKLTVRQARLLGVEADRRRLETEAIVRAAEDEAAKELGLKQAEAKVAQKAAQAEVRRIKKEQLAEEKQLNAAARRTAAEVERAVEVVPQTKAGEQRAKISRLKELIDPETEAMLQVMFDIAKDEKVHASIRMECADRVLSRGYGKPKEHVEVSDAAAGAEATDEVMTLLGNIFEAVGLPPLLEAKGSLGVGQGSPSS